MLLKKLFRTMLGYKAQFISMIIMVALGVGVFLGFNMEWKTIEKNTEKFFDETNFADFRLVSTDESGFSASDAEKIKNIAGVEAAGRYISENAYVAGTKKADSNSEKTVALTVTENKNVSFFKLTGGDEYDETSESGVWLSEKFASEAGFKCGDKITFKYSVFVFKGEVKGLVKSGEHMICLADSTQLMPKFDDHGFAYISPAFYAKALAEKGLSPIYPQINVISGLSKSEISSAADAVLGKTTLLLTRAEVISSAGAESETEEGKTMGSVIPVVFLVIAVLTMVTTMHRLTVKEKTQIGTLKALGFKDKTVTLHYTSYALAIGVLGSVLGIGLGYGIAAFVMNPKGMMGTYLDMPYWKIYTPWYCWLVIAAIVATLTVIGMLSVKKMLAGTAADALRPHTPKKMKNLAVEKTALWKKFSFGTKWNLRDVMRHKARTGMSLIGVLGCVIILVGALGMKDTMQAFLDDYYNTAMKYETRVDLDENSGDNLDKIEFAKSLAGDRSASVSVEFNEKAVSVDVYDVSHGMVNFPDKKGDSVALPDDGALICTRLAKDYGLKPGDTFTVKPYGTDKSYTLKVAAVIRSVSENAVISEKYADNLGLAYKISAIYTNETAKEVLESKSFVKKAQSREDIMKSFDSFTQLLNQSVTILIAAGVVLGLIVLYNLGVMSYTERYREMATLKVVGFKDKKIASLLITQNLWVTCAGVLFGIPLGAGVLGYLVTALAAEYEMRVRVSPITVIIAAAATFAVSFAVSFAISKKNKKIDMVEALKGAE